MVLESGKAIKNRRNNESTLPVFYDENRQSIESPSKPNQINSSECVTHFRMLIITVVCPVFIQGPTDLYREHPGRERHRYDGWTRVVTATWAPKFACVKVSYDDFRSRVKVMLLAWVNFVTETSRRVKGTFANARVAGRFSAQVRIIAARQIFTIASETLEIKRCLAKTGMTQTYICAVITFSMEE